MATKPWSAAFLDPALNFLKNNSNRLVLCSHAPETFTEAWDTYRLADIAVNPAVINGPLNGQKSGRRLDIIPSGEVTVAATGVAQFFALVNTTNQVLHYVGPFTFAPLNMGDEIVIDITRIELEDPF